MRFDVLPLSLALTLFLSVDYALGAPSSHDQRSTEPSSSRGIHIPITRRVAPQRNDADPDKWVEQKHYLEVKYGVRPGGASGRRSEGYNMLVNQGLDSTYYGSIAVGNPAVAYDVILDTGSADLWLASSGCTQNCNGLQLFNPSSSTTFSNSSQEFSIQYGSGEAAGVLGSDDVQMAGFLIKKQVFAVCNQLSQDLLSAPISGILGLGWQALATSRATPFWQALASGNQFDEPLMGFYITRFQDVSGAKQEEPGGVFTMGTTNTSLYTGDIDYIDIPSGAVSYWTLPLTRLTVGSTSITLPSGSASYAAIDTGTTLIGGPAAQVAALYAQIPGSAASTEQEGYFTYPCSTNVNISLSFGGKTWSIDPDDFKLTTTRDGNCLGAIFEFSGTSTTGSGNSALAWIIGDTFLKNVYSVFRYNPASVGFATVAPGAEKLVTQLGVPTPTIGAVSATITATGQNAASPVAVPHLALLSLCALGTSLFYLL